MSLSAAAAAGTIISFGLGHTLLTGTYVDWLAAVAIAKAMPAWLAACMHQQFWVQVHGI